MAMTCSRIMVVRFFAACGSFGTRLRLSRSAAIRSSTRTTRGRVKSNKLRLDICIGPKIHNQFSPRSSRCSQSAQRRNTSTSLFKRKSDLVVPLFSFDRNLRSILTRQMLAQQRRQTGNRDSGLDTSLSYCNTYNMDC
jgi:hypothetical protein